jgi:hypothetical protein
MADESLGLSGFGLRFAAALALVLLAFNPTGWSHIRRRLTGQADVDQLDEQ